MILVFEEQLAHYTIPVLEKLQVVLEEELVVVHGSPYPGAALNTADTGDVLPFKHIKAPTLWVHGKTLSIRFVWKYLWRYIPSAILVRGTIRNAELFSILLYARAAGVPVITWGQGFSRRRPFRPYSHPVDRAYLAVIQMSDAYVCYTGVIRNTLTQYVSRSNLFVANNTLDTDKHQRIRKSLSSIGKEAVKQSLNLRNKPYLCFIGRLQPRKKVDQLLEAHKLVQRRYGLDVGLIIVGNGPERSRLEKMAGNLGASDVHFVGAKYDDEAGRYLYASDLVVIPGWLGLAANHALIYGRPVVSQYAGHESYHKVELVGHPPEATHIQVEQNGAFAEHQNPVSLAKAIVRVLVNQEQYAANAAHYAASHLTVDSMIDGFQAAIQYAKSQSTPHLVAPHH